MEEPKRNQNEFNNAFGFIQRLDKIFYLLADSKTKNAPINYIRSIKLLFHELIGEMNDTEIKEYKTKIRKYERELMTINSLNKKIDNSLIDDLEDLEILLRKIYKNSGLQNKYKDSWYSDTNAFNDF